VADLTTLADVKEWLSIPTSTISDDALLQRLITAMSSSAESYMGRTIASATYTETLNGRGKSVLAFGQAPVTAVTSVTVDGVAIPSRASTGSRGYAFDQQLLYLDGYAFTRGVLNVTLVYAAGFAAVPSDIAQAVIQLVGLRYKSREHIGESSKQLAGGGVSWFHEVPQEVLAIFDQYKRPYAGGYAT